ncbi:hypothetical protein FKP32DRAFT_1682681 [Trametes sanguinea]|nr:hypothetical protein FKP32DRAFT_1688214 [Trametes sanguinea]KAI9064785.1 hypothetical protein FKP32DRAFT_1757161 [Trametes sanguinea]KAI9066629.1 hypothetical protein FKP32DRAFT_1684394 [Trametes sanguinea]KAI9068035.1 hypothetical protein FKP32DRAFT_1754764 [Trametes sanguinea]KAI9068598.1 hypothetical protein FKP32DRAFT_1754326 [Trametes sanguinea]
MIIALPTLHYLNVMQVVGGDYRAHGNVDFNTFINSIQFAGFKPVPYTGTALHLKHGAAGSLHIDVPDDVGHWYPYQYLHVVDQFERLGVSFMEGDADGEAILVPDF